MLKARQVLLYAQSIPSLSTPLSKILPANFKNTEAEQRAVSDDQYNAILGLVLPDQYSWGAALWFLTSQCKNMMEKWHGMQGHGAFMDLLGCMGTLVMAPGLEELDDPRMVVWMRSQVDFDLWMTRLAKGDPFFEWHVANT